MPRFHTPKSELVRKSVYFALVVFLICVLLLGRETFSIGPSHVIPEHNSSPTPTPTPLSHGTQTPVPAPDPIVFSLIMWSKSSATEGSLLIKSIVMYSSRPTDIHIICDDAAERVVRSRLSLLERPLHQVRVWFHKPTWQGMLDRVEREGSIQTDHSAGLPGLMKLFIHEILPSNVTKSIFVDTDAFFISDPALLWNIFDTLRPQTSLVMASHPDQDSPEWNNASRICSCVMLLDLAKLRKDRLMHSSVYAKIKPDNPGQALSTPAFRAMYGLPGGDGKGRYTNVRLGDQGYWWAIVDYHKNIFEPLSFDFEVTSCLMDTYLTGLGADTITEKEELKHQIHLDHTPQEGKAVLPKLLHFNCLHGTDIYMNWAGWNDPNDYLNVRWGDAMRYHNGYKWIWLNQGDRKKPLHQVEMYTNDKVVFADEKALKRHMQHIQANKHGNPHHH
ncbi:hypothetical protein H1R20_g5686, partial [Candolleomyces eurysporus]